MIQFKRVTLKNFMSYGNNETTFDLSTKESILVIGNNEDVGDKGNSRNGSGKTSSVQAIVFAIYGKGLDKLKSDEFVNIKNGKNLVVSLDFEKNGVQYTITRKRKPASVEIIADGVSLTLDTIRNTDQFIESLIGIPYDVFLTTFTLTPHVTPFLAMGAADQRSVIESVLSLDVLSKRAEDVKTLRSDLMVDHKVLTRDVENAVANNAKIDRRIAEYEAEYDAFEAKRKSSLLACEELITELNALEMTQIKRQLKERESDLAKITDLRLSVLEKRDELNQLKLSYADSVMKRNNLIKISEKIKTIRDEISEFENNKTIEIEKLNDIISNASSSEIIDYINAIIELKALYSDNQKKSFVISMKDRDIESVLSDLEALQNQQAALEHGKCQVCGGDYCDSHLLENVAKKITSITSSITEMVNEYEVMINDFYDTESEINGICNSLNVSIDEFDSVIAEMRAEYDVVRDAERALKDYEQKGSVDGLHSVYTRYIEEHPTVDDDIEQIVVDIVTCNEQIGEFELEISTLLDNIKKLESKKYEYLDLSGVYDERSLIHLVEQLRGVQQEIESIKTELNPYIRMIANMRDLLIDQSQLNGDLSELNTTIESANYLIKLLTNNNSFIRKNIVDIYIPYMNKKIVEYTDILGLLHICTINNDLSSDISYMGKNVSYYNLSQGERLRVNLAVNLAFRDLLSSLGKSTNILMVDEWLDSGSDESLVSRAMGLLKTKADHVVIISHKSEIRDYVDRVVTITKRNGFSVLEDDIL